MIQQKQNIQIWQNNFEKIPIEKIYEIYKIVKEFFGGKKEIDIRIILCSDKEELMFFTGIENLRENITGRAIPELNLIAVYTPEAIEKNTPKSKHNFRGIIAHEIAHLFYHQQGYLNKLQLFNEGIASYIQWIIINKKEFENKNILAKTNILQEYSAEIYKEGIFFIDEFIKKISKEKLFEFLDSTKKINSNKKIKNEFDKMLKKELKGGIKNG